jgi:enamine deaminase RidA (YjgF/YER057c/UK114 family)
MAARKLIIPQGMENIYREKRYAPGVRVGDMLYISGMLGRDGDLNVIEDPEAQFTAVFNNTGKVLAAAGASFDDVIEFTGYFTHLQRDFPLFQTVKDRYVAGDLPAQTAIGITELSTPGLLVELKCTALIPGAG